MCLGQAQERVHSDSLPGQQSSARMRRSLGMRPHRPFKSSGRHVLGRCGSKEGVSTDRHPGESARGGAVLCIGTCRNLPATRSRIAKESIPVPDPFWDAQKRSWRPVEGRSCRWIELPDLPRCRSQPVVKVLQNQLGAKNRSFPPCSKPVIASKGDATIFAKGCSVYVGFSIASGYRCAPTLEYPPRLARLGSQRPLSVLHSADRTSAGLRHREIAHLVETGMPGSGKTFCHSWGVMVSRS